MSYHFSILTILTIITNCLSNLGIFKLNLFEITFYFISIHDLHWRLFKSSLILKLIYHVNIQFYHIPSKLEIVRKTGYYRISVSLHSRPQSKSLCKHYFYRLHCKLL